MKKQPTYEDCVDRFWSYVDVKSDDECWPWEGGRFNNGYGRFTYTNKNILAHRFAYEFAHGLDSAKGKIVRHTCDNPPCCNPLHLKIGTQQDNMDDKFARGRDRAVTGEDHPASKLTERDVTKIKELLLTKTARSIAVKYQVDPVTILDIKFGRTWKGVGTDHEYKKNKVDIKTYIKSLLKNKDAKFVTHYVDGDRTNQDHSNIVVCPNHAYHELLRQRKDAYEACGHADWIKCTYCKQYDKPENMMQKKGDGKYRPDESYYRFHKDCQLKYQRDLRKSRK
jgi:hypothetical protein